MLELGLELGEGAVIITNGWGSWGWECGARASENGRSITIQVELGPHELYTKASTFTVEQRQALWDRAQKYRTGWKKIRSSSLLLSGLKSESTLKYHAIFLGIL